LKKSSKKQPVTKPKQRPRAPVRRGRTAEQAAAAPSAAEQAAAAERLGFVEWIERNIRLPETSAQPGAMKLWPWQYGLAEAIGNPNLERVTLQKATRLGFSSLITAYCGYVSVVEHPSTILFLQPTQDDARGFVVDDLESLYDATPILQGKLLSPSVATRGSRRDRNTLLHRLWDGGSIKVVAAKAPRNLRRHTARFLIVDEADACEDSAAEGDVITLAERRTMTHSNRKIILGGSPIDEVTSHVLRSFNESDRRVFEIPCPSCGAFTELMWRHLEWEPDRPETTKYRCEHCKQLISEHHKPAMVAAGRWRITDPSVVNHAGFRLNSLVSLLDNCAWPKLVAEFLRAKNDPDTKRLKAFTCAILGQAWRDDADEIDDLNLIARAEPFDTDHIDPAVLYLTRGVDPGTDRIETSLLGHTRNGEILVLSHDVIWASIEDDDTWLDLDDLLKTEYKHPYGGTLKVDATVVDAGFCFDKVIQFCSSRYARRILPGKGAPGFARPAIALTKTKRNKRLFLTGVDGLKSGIINRLARGTSIRFSHTLDQNYLRQSDVGKACHQILTWPYNPKLRPPCRWQERKHRLPRLRHCSQSSSHHELGRPRRRLADATTTNNTITPIGIVAARRHPQQVDEPQMTGHCTAIGFTDRQFFQILMPVAARIEHDRRDLFLQQLASMLRGRKVSSLSTAELMPIAIRARDLATPRPRFG
jgi:phage terminase large subunit GpA-like protein